MPFLSRKIVGWPENWGKYLPNINALKTETK
jgi:hypothetical protein